MRFGLLLNEPTGQDPLAELGDAIAQAAEDGFDSAWSSHIFGVDALTALAVAGRGHAIELGTAVVPVYPRHPAALAQQAMTANAALGGRLTLGIGLSHQVVIENMYGYSYDKPARHMTEYLNVLLPASRGEQVDYTGETVKANIRLGTPGAGFPVLIAALGPRMLKLAGTVADGTVLWMTGPKTVADHIAPTINAAAAEAGREPPRIVCELPVSVTDDPDAARARANEIFEVYGQLPSYRAMLDREGAAGPGDVAIVGDESSVRAQIDQLAEAGVTDFVAAVLGDRRRTLDVLIGASKG
ncbi:TIGR03564 family F420-dependent LLM class oxidoreductase [Nonomuraea glycinis]|uniref:LLM class F420-dependent oxidoreductase n=1 Tax=Nonomuraea glycinis TaxID=2047744 RepID=A0A918ADP2_9ACTN|nr:TIGR03564 family F420-dependent LLM class oxidoreductase [Nonomuraea glycinis]MCA2181904.1 TIGR03564 family F420-dependent LLM class oxidoreductase [Nonomuraea glycinis]GGP15825.1 LLM class F420-dependent oxidoreductase [Nonomuraea glycinis]